MRKDGEMIKRIIFIVLSVVLLFSASGCGKPKAMKVTVSGNKTVGVWQGQMLKIELASNATTGYLWRDGDLSGNKVLEKLGKYRYVHKSRLVGAGGTQVFRFKAAKKGKEKLVFEYIRPWEKDKKPAKKYVVKVIVH